MFERIRSDFWYELLNAPVTVVSALIIALMILGCTFAPIVAPHTPFDPGTISILDNNLPPSWLPGGDARYLLGTDLQGRDVREDAETVDQS